MLEGRRAPLGHAVAVVHVAAPEESRPPEGLLRLRDAESGETREVLFDDAAAAAKDARSFLWHVFTRFEPGADVHAARTQIVRNQIARSAPIVLDARMKPWMPGVVEADAATVARVDRRWRDYFPAGRAGSRL